MHTLLYIKQKTTEDLQYSTGNASQYSTVTEEVKNGKRIDSCICIGKSLCCTPETNTTLLINYTAI